MNKKSVSQKEILLLITLLVLVAFYLVDTVLLQGKIDTLTSTRDSLQAQVDSLKPLNDQMDVWEASLEKTYKKYGGQPKSIPDYNNINGVISEMSIIFDGDSSYTINFSDPSFEDHIATRNITITFSCAGYEETINKLYKINSSNNRYRITNLSVVENGSDMYSVSFNIIAYEYSGEKEAA